MAAADNGKERDGMKNVMKYIKKIIFAVIYIAFAYIYSLLPELHLRGGLAVSVNPFDLETFIMMLFIGVYLTAFWIVINKLFRN